MHPDAARLWTAPRWALAILLALLGMLGPFSIDTYIPAFAAIGQSLQATPVQMQQTLSAYLLGFAFMNLFHGALSDSFGRRPVILWGLALFALASVGCALSQSVGQLIFFRALQGFSTGAGIVVSRAVIRDMFPPHVAQRVMSQVTIFFGVAPAVAPMNGGLIAQYLNWHAIFWFLVAVGVLLWLANWRLLPETLHASHRQPFQVGHLMRGYGQLLSDPRFMLLALASGVPFNGLFLYVLSAPAFLGEILQLAPTQFFWFFVLNISGIMAGSWLSGRKAGKVSPKNQILQGFRIMLAVSLIAGVVGAVADRDLRLRLGADGAGGDSAGARPAPRSAWHGVVAAGGGGLDRQRHRGRRGGPTGHAFGARAGRDVGRLHAGRPGGLAVAAPALARDRRLSETRPVPQRRVMHAI